MKQITSSKKSQTVSRFLTDAGNEVNHLFSYEDLVDQKMDPLIY